MEPFHTLGPEKRRSRFGSPPEDHRDPPSPSAPTASERRPTPIRSSDKREGSLDALHRDASAPLPRGLHYRMGQRFSGRMHSGRRSLRTDGISRSIKNIGMGTRWYCWESWLWRDRHDLNFVATLISEQNNLVSLLLYTPTHLFSPHTDLTTTSISWQKETTLFCRLKSGWETKERTLRAPQVSDHASVSPRPTAAAATLPDCFRPPTPHRDPIRTLQ